jgi:tripartite-type tricarboxylate transporter receptor subunit TctC
METFSRRDILGGFGALALGSGLTFPLVAGAQQRYPDRPVKVVVSSAPGGIDTIVRLIAPDLQERTGQAFVVDNKAGANGILGVQAVTSAPADGYTILFTTISTLTINPFVYANLPYHPLRDLEPVALHATLPMVWVSHPARGFKSLKEVVAFAKANPGKLNVANPGNGSFGHLLEEALRKKHDIDIALIPFKTTPQAMLETLAGRVDLCVDNISNLMPHISQGKLVPLAVTSRQRSSALPTVPSWLEDGSGDFEADAWYAFMAPKGTPPHIVQTLNAAITAAIEAPTARKYLQATGAQFVERSPAKVREFIQGELDKYGAIVKRSNIALQ